MSRFTFSVSRDKLTDCGGSGTSISEQRTAASRPGVSCSWTPRGSGVDFTVSGNERTVNQIRYEQGER